jgi:hypothetical protein
MTNHDVHTNDLGSHNVLSDGHKSRLDVHNGRSGVRIDEA